MLTPLPPLPPGRRPLCLSHKYAFRDTHTLKLGDIVDGLQEAVSQQEKELAEERKRQKNVLDDQRRILQSLEENMQEREIALAKTKEEVSHKRKIP